MADELWTLFEAHADRGTFERFARQVPEEWIEQALAASGVATLRRRRIPAERVVWLVVGMALFRDLPIDAVLRHLDVALPAKSGKAPAKSGVAQARQRLGAEPLRRLFERTGKHWAEQTAGRHRWRGLTLWGIDSTTVRVPDSIENREHFGGRSNQRSESGYPSARILTLMALRSHVLSGARIAPVNTNELRLAADLWDEIPDQSLTLVDRGFLYAEALMPLAESGRHWLTRARKNTSYEVVKKLGPGDEIVELKVTWQARQHEPNLERTWRARAIRYQRKGFPPQVLLTSLLDPVQYPRGELAALYHERWEIELGYDEVKTEMLERIETLRSQRPAGVLQEIWGLLLAYNLVRLEMEATAVMARVPPSRMSFVAGLRLVRDTLRLAALVSPGKLAKFLDKERAALSHFILPPRRPQRAYPRAVKVKMSHYDRKRPSTK
jgi:hypothetical protein